MIRVSAGEPSTGGDNCERRRGVILTAVDPFFGGGISMSRSSETGGDDWGRKSGPWCVAGGRQDLLLQYATAAPESEQLEEEAGYDNNPTAGDQDNA